MNTAILINILIATAVVTGTAVLIAVLLGIFGRKFAVEVNEKEAKVRELLPGNNCGGCGYAGCDGLAKAIAEGKAPANACPVGINNHVAIAAVMGATVEAEERRAAFVHCSGTCDKTAVKYHYDGIADCRKLALIPGHGEKVCSAGCMGYGTCVRTCPFGAITVINGVAVVDSDKCTACGKCVSACPNGLIRLEPARQIYRVVCDSHAPGKSVRAACEAGCIGCGICAKVCESGAVTVENNLASIDPGKCTACGKCAEKCPRKIIKLV